ncbi:Sensor histidine kinase graS [uncultured Eubacterium sp.]|nr:Sensor histidine kinase graS [uncultured Eubacterium sp.]
MKFRDYLSAKTITLSFLCIGALLAGVFLAFAEVSISLIAVMELFFLFLTGSWLLVSFVMERRNIRGLQKLEKELEDKYLLGEILPPPTGYLEQQYYRMFKTISRSAVGLVEETRREKEEYCDYVESWIHEIKTPLTACSLILDNDGDVRKLRRELKRADNLTENILYYARLRSAEKDTKIRILQAAAVIEEAVKSQMELLIASKISVETEGSFTVCTDDKSLCFILKQLLINSAKYCPGCHVNITAVDGKIIFEDDGIGIPSHEIRRVTERGFTGSNGRHFGRSTGMGLYIANELCKRLDIELQVESEEEKYTRITLLFRNLTKL